MGLEIVEDTADYLRLRAPGGTSTLALHIAHGQSTESVGARIYFEVPDLEKYCERLTERRIKFDQPPRRMEWGWKHAYLKDPDGHELSLYYAGSNRIKPKTGR